MQIEMKFLTETKTCYRFEAGNRDAGNQMTLYLKKASVDEAGINPHKGIKVTIEEARDNDTV